MAIEKQRSDNGRFLKTPPNAADTGSVVNEVHGTVSFGRIAGQKDFDGRSASRNPMVSGNTGMRRKNGG